MAFLEKAIKIQITRLWCNVSLQRFIMNFKNIRLPIAYSGVSRREIFQNSDLIGMNRGYQSKLLKFSLFCSGNARASLRITFLSNPYWHI